MGRLNPDDGSIIDENPSRTSGREIPGDSETVRFCSVARQNEVIGMFRKSEDGGTDPHLEHQRETVFFPRSSGEKPPTAMLTQRSRGKLQQRKDRR